jgi:hypothetical protein
MLQVFVRKVLGFVGTTAETLADAVKARLHVDQLGALWVRDYLSQPAQGWKLITKDDAGALAGKYRALRFDVAGAVKVDVLDPDGTAVNTLIRNVQAGEVWPAACVRRVYNTGTDAAVVVDGWS